LAAETHAVPDVQVEERLRVSGDEPFGQGCGLREERPVPVPPRERGVGAPPHFAGRDDVEHGEPFDRVRVVERHPVGDAAAAVVAGDGEPVESDRGHRLDLVEGHRALAVGRVVGRRRRAERVAVAREVGGHHGVAFGEQGRDRMPHQLGLGIAVQEQDRRAAPADLRADRPARGGDVLVLEAGERPSAVEGATQGRHRSPRLPRR
jgi:hypothetical protein